MVKVAVCGNMVFQEGGISSLLRTCACECGIEAPSIREFPNPTDLIDACVSVPPDTEPLDLIVAAMDLPGLSGVHLAEELRDAGVIPHDLRMVLCAPSTDQAYHAYAAGVSDYLVEPVASEDFLRVVGSALSRIARVHEASAVVHCRKRVRRIAFPRIRYVETFGHDQVIHLVDEREPSVVRGSSKTMFALLEGDCRFFKVGSSYIVNLDYVKQLTAHVGALTFDDGFQIPVPVRCRKALGDAVANHAMAVL